MLLLATEATSHMIMAVSPAQSDAPLAAATSQLPAASASASTPIIATVLAPVKPSWLKQTSEDFGAVGSILWVCLLIVVFSLLGYLLAREWRRKALVIEPFEIPKELAEAGLTGSVFALRLSDQLVQIQRDARLDDDPRDIVFTELPQFQVDLQLPGVAWSVRGAIRYLRQALGRPEPRIVGEVVKHRSRYVVRLRSHTLRFADVEVPFHGMSDLADALQSSAESALRLIAPLEAASIFYVQEPRHSGYPKTIASLQEYLKVEPAHKHQNAYVIWATVHRAMGDFDLMRGKLALARSIGAPGTRFHNFVGGLSREQGEFEGARESFRWALKAQPDNLSALTNLGLLSTDEWKLEDAENWFRQVISTRPNSSRGYRGMGLVANKRFQVRQALAHFERAIDVAPLSRWPRINKIVALKQLGAFDRAEEAIEEFRSIEPDFAPLLRAQAEVNRDRGDYESSLAINARAIGADPYDPWAYEQRAELLRRMGRSSEAEQAARQALRVRPRFANALAVLARCALDASRPDDAITLFEQAVSLAPYEPWVNAALVHELRKLGRFQDAKDALARIPAGAQWTPDVLRAEAALHEALGDLQMALDRLDNAISLAPHEPWAQMHRARILLRLGNVADCEKQVAELEQTWSVLPDVWKLRGDFQREQEDLAGAQSQYERLLRDAPMHQLARLPLADLLRRRSKFSEALDLTRQELDMRPNSLDARLTWSDILRDQGDLVQALGVSEEVKALAPYEPRAEMCVVDVLVRMKKPEQGLERIEALLAKRPDLGRAWRLKADALRALSKPNLAVQALREATKVEPWEPWAYLAIGWILLKDDPAEAARYARLALERRAGLQSAVDLLQRLGQTS